MTRYSCMHIPFKPNHVISIWKEKEGSEITYIYMLLKTLDGIVWRQLYDPLPIVDTHTNYLHTIAEDQEYIYYVYHIQELYDFRLRDGVFCQHKTHPSASYVSHANLPSVTEEDTQLILQYIRKSQSHM